MAVCGFGGLGGRGSPQGCYDFSVEFGYEAPILGSTGLRSRFGRLVQSAEGLDGVLEVGHQTFRDVAGARRQEPPVSSRPVQ